MGNMVLVGSHSSDDSSRSCKRSCGPSGTCGSSTTTATSATTTAAAATTTATTATTRRARQQSRRASLARVPKGRYRPPRARLVRVGVKVRRSVDWVAIRRASGWGRGAAGWACAVALGSELASELRPG
eukprot:scaffold49156_cov60-Phaeocystis_antarctica.AAC.5